MQTLTNITINQKDIEGKIHKLKVKKATGPDGVSARLLKSAGKSVVPSLKRVFEHSAKACKHQNSGKQLELVQHLKKELRKIEHVIDHYLCLVSQ
ncbi:hypothetical protein OS493_023308, partial [Desmophyllum pertusum]